MHDISLITTIAVGCTAALVLGLLTQRLGLSPIIGYLVAGVLVGPHTPGFVGDPGIASQLAEVGVILLMFGVGLHFHLKDLLGVKGVAIPGAIGQSLAATLLAMAVFAAFGMPVKTGAVIGMAMAVASTVVLMRVLTDADALNTPQGIVAVGWLIVEDVFTVVLLVLIPVLGGGGSEAVAVTVGAVAATQEGGGATELWKTLGIALLKMAALVGIVLLAGSRMVPWALVQIARLRSRELFTLAVLVFSIAIAAGSYVFFGASMALGAFLAGMVVAQSPVSHQAAADALPMRDAFAVLFFVSVGMLFDPRFLIEEPLMIAAALGIVMVAKPLAALGIVALLGHSARTALTVAIGLAQIGEFSFILSELARRHGLMPDAGHNMLVAAAIISITLNPMLFRALPKIEAWLSARPRLWGLLNGRAERRMREINAEASMEAARRGAGMRGAIVVGYGPVGRSVDQLLREAGLRTTIIDLNMDTVRAINREGRTAIYGDASRGTVLEQAGVARASHLVLTLPHSAERAVIVSAGRELNRDIRILVRARYLREREDLEQAGATAAVFEEAEAAVGLARLVLAGTGASRETVERSIRDLRLRLIRENVSNLRGLTVRSVMVPWTRVHRISNRSSHEEVLREVSRQRFSRWPVVDPKSDRPVGYLLTKDLVAEARSVSEWTSLVRPLSAVRPEDSVETTLIEMQRDGATVRVVEEGGNPAGLITIEDIIEQVVGVMEDEYPRHKRLILRDALEAGAIVPELGATTKEQAIVELAAALPDEGLPAGVNIAGLALEREREVSTDIGFGVAIPHARCPSLARPLLAVGRSRDGVAVGTRANEPIHLFFLLVTPTAEPDLQVQLLGRVATVIGDATVRQRLQDAGTAGEMAGIIGDAEGRFAGLQRRKAE